jgi:hypothetical protein
LAEEQRMSGPTENETPSIGTGDVAVRSSIASGESSVSLRAPAANPSDVAATENVTTIATDSGILVAVNADVYYKQGGL